MSFDLRIVGHMLFNEYSLKKFYKFYNLIKLNNYVIERAYKIKV